MIASVLLRYSSPDDDPLVVFLLFRKELVIEIK